MSDFKSKLPDLQELSSMAGKFLKDVKTSLSEIMDNYKRKREVEEAAGESNAKIKTESKRTKESDVEVKPKRTRTVKKDKTEDDL